MILIVCNDENEYKKSRVYEIKLVRKTIHFRKKKHLEGVQFIRKAGDEI